MANTNDMIHIAQCKFQQFICKDTSRVRKPEKTMIRKASPQPHSPSMENCLMAKTTQRSVAMDNVDLLADQNIAEDGEE